LAKREQVYYDDGANMAVIVVDNASRGIAAYLGGANFWAQAGQVDLANAPRSPGSALKPFIYGLAFDDSIVHPQTLIDDKPTAFRAREREELTAFASTERMSVAADEEHDVAGRQGCDREVVRTGVAGGNHRGGRSARGERFQHRRIGNVRARRRERAVATA